MVMVYNGMHISLVVFYRPSDLLITAMVQAHVLDNNTDEAW